MHFIVLLFHFDQSPRNIKNGDLCTRKETFAIQWNSIYISYKKPKNIVNIISPHFMLGNQKMHMYNNNQELCSSRQRKRQIGKQIYFEMVIITKKDKLWHSSDTIKLSNIQVFILVNHFVSTSWFLQGVILLVFS